MNKYLGYSIGAVVTGAIAYVIYRSYKAYKEDNKKIVITPEDIEIKKEFDAKSEAIKEHIKDKEDIELEVKSIDDILVENDEEYETIEYSMSENIFNFGEDYWDEDEDEFTGILLRRGDSELRYEPNSEEALLQYKNMVISDYDEDPEMWGILDKLFDYAYSPRNEEDANIVRNITEERIGFFGPDSRWNDYVTFTELLVYYANKLTWDFNTPIVGGMKVILDSIELDMTSGDIQIDKTISDLTKHDFVSKDERYGLFGLTLEDYRERLLRYPEKNIQTNADISFYMEYNVFCHIYGDDFVKGF